MHYSLIIYSLSISNIIVSSSWINSYLLETIGDHSLSLKHDFIQIGLLHLKNHQFGSFELALIAPVAQRYDQISVEAFAVTIMNIADDIDILRAKGTPSIQYTKFIKEIYHLWFTTLMETQNIYCDCLFIHRDLLFFSTLKLAVSQCFFVKFAFKLTSFKDTQLIIQ